MMLVLRFLRDETAATSIEYGLIAGLIAVAIISAITRTGTSLQHKFTQISGNLT